MIRILSYPLAAQMLMLGLAESLICFTLLLLVPFAAGMESVTASVAASNAGLAALPDPLQAAALAAAATGLLMALAAALGLYRPENFVASRVLLLKVASAAAVSLLLVWKVGKLTGMELGAVLDWNPLWPVEMLFAWTGVLLASRLAYSYSLRLHGIGRRLTALGAEAGAAPFALDTGYAAPVAASGTRGMVELDPLGLRAPEAHTAAEGWTQRAARRGLDLVAASLLLLFTLPLLLLTAVLVKLESRGPILYRQERVGLHGKPFTLAKFRSMRVDAERDGPVWAAQRDSRVTRVGRFIRKVRIDELPQLLNILAGDMSLIGPRPERPHFVRQLAQAIPGFEQRTQVKPGLTGWAQINYPYGASVEDARAKLAYDLYYVRNRSWLLDLRIVLGTIRVVLLQEGAR